MQQRATAARSRPEAAGPLISIVVNNYNYGRFLPRSINSALGQTYPNVEVLVVDDASTDDSRRVIERYGNRIRPVLRKKNGGQGAAFNDGFAASKGELVIYLDADDYLYPSAAERVASVWKPGVCHVHYRLDLTDPEGRILDTFPEPGVSLDQGDLRPIILRGVRYSSTVTSGNAFARSTLSAILPAPVDDFRLAADGYVVTLAPLFGRVVAIDESLGAYVQHGDNLSDFQRRLGERLRWRIDHDQRRHRVLAATVAKLDLQYSGDPARDDAFFLESRIGSLCLEPELHPLPDDRRLTLGLRGAWACRIARRPLVSRAILAAWFLLVALLPRSLACKTVSWRMAKSSRPPVVDRFVRLVRRAAR